MGKALSLIIMIVLMTSCNPYMHIGGAAMRKYNLSQNKYTPNNPYTNYRKTKPKKQREHRFLFWLWRNI